MPTPASIHTMVCAACGRKKTLLSDHPITVSSHCLSCGSQNLLRRTATQKEAFKARLELFITELEQDH